VIFREVAGGVEFQVKVVGGSSGNRVVGELGDMLKLGVSAPRERGKANQALTKLLADKLGVSKAAIRIISGKTSSKKTIFVESVSRQECEASLLKNR